MAHDDSCKKRVTIYQVSRESGYSLATVSRVINDKDNVTEETKRKVNEAIAKLGYKPSAIAQGLAKSKTTNIGIVIPAHLHTYVSNMLSGMVDIAKIYGYQTILFVTSSIEEESSEIIEKVISASVDGVVVFDDQLKDSDIKKFDDYSIPCAVIGREIKGENFASIPLLYEKAIRTCVKDHFKMGDEPIYALLTSKPGAINSYLAKVCLDECKKIGKEDKYKEIRVDDSYTSTYNQFMDFFKDKNKKGFFIGEIDSITCAVANAAGESGLCIPKDIQLMSIIGTKHSTMARPSLTSLDIDMYEVGSIAMRMLTKLLDHSLKTKVYPFEASIKVRQSSRN